MGNCHLLQLVAKSLVAAFLAAALAACGTSQDTGGFFVAPGRYDIYTCAQIADSMEAVQKEGQRLEGLMARASKDASGRIVNAIAYESDYQANRGALRELQKSAAAKNCTNVAVASPGGRASNSAVR
jgi:hypothetical protein